jgi:outer membrane protein OmpA-like peptidoglycan-associated protein
MVNMKPLIQLSSAALIVTLVASGTQFGVAFAVDEGEGITIENFKPSTSVNSIFELTLPEPKEHLEWYVGGLINYAHKPVRLERQYPWDPTNPDVVFPVKGRITLDLFAAMAFFGWLEAGLAVPVIVYQAGEGWVEPADPLDPVPPSGTAQVAGLGDPRLQLKARFLDVADFELGVGAIATFPAGHYASSGTDLMGTHLPTIEPQLLASYYLGPVVIGVNGGFLVRPETYMGTYEQTHAVTWNAGVGWDIWDFHEPGGLRVAVETNGEAGILFEVREETPMEVLAGIKYRTRGDLIVTAGAGTGLSPAVGTPAFRIFAGLAFDDVLRSCAAGEEDLDGFEDHDKCIDPDNDQDGLLDVDDPCPNEAEDIDEFEDEDGCPDNDNDGDGIQDVLDICPMIAEDKDNFEDEDGCPEEGPGKPTVTITDTQLLISSKIYFDFNKDNIKEVSYPILDAVAEALLANPHIVQVRVEGHTDNEGTEEYNLDLSTRRAKAVVEYLIGKDVPAERLTFEGYGFTKPKASNKTAEGRAINRRVEFTILQKEQQ